MAYEIKNAGLAFPQARTKRSRTEGIIIHHPAATNWTVNDVHNYHKNTNGWNGIGYNFYIHKDGTIYEGRGLEYMGAHVSAYNSKTIGICCQGDFENVDVSMTDAQYNSLIWLIEYCKGVYGSGLYVKGHRDVSATACPGKNFPLDEVKAGKYRGDGTSNSTNTSNTTSTTTSSGDAKILEIQRTVNSRYGLNIAEDGIYGSETKGALVYALQTELNNQFGANLSRDKIFGINTYNACVTVKQGAEGNITYILQAMLYVNGYDTNGIDGIFGSGTDSAVRAYQKDNGLSVDGIAGKNTFARLFGYN